MLAEAVKMTTASEVKINNGCSKCAILKHSGKLSCCSRGGTWFRNCGDAGDSKFDHTWSEGMEACKRKSKANSISLNC